MSLHLHLPMIELPIEEHWGPAHRSIWKPGSAWPVRYDQVALTVRMLGYVLVPLIVGGIAGSWLRRRGSEK